MRLIYHGNASVALPARSAAPGAVLDVCSSLRGRALRLPERTSLIDDGGRIGHSPFHPRFDARSFDRLALFLVQLVPLRFLERGFRADVDG
jgi:hypothetical protein